MKLFFFICTLLYVQYSCFTVQQNEELKISETLMVCQQLTFVTPFTFYFKSLYKLPLLHLLQLALLYFDILIHVISNKHKHNGNKLNYIK